MTKEEMLEKLENATDDEAVELMNTYVDASESDNEELSENDLEDVAGGVVYITSVSDLQRRYNKLPKTVKNLWKGKLAKLLKDLLKFGKIAMPF